MRMFKSVRKKSVRNQNVLEPAFSYYSYVVMTIVLGSHWTILLGSHDYSPPSQDYSLK